MYIQTLSNGYRIEPTDDDNVHEYHGAVGMAPFLCKKQASSG